MKNKKLILGVPSRFKRRLISQGFNPKALILFGSRARGESLKHSDYDFLIVSDKFKRMHPLKRMEEMELLWDEPRQADFICFTQEEFERKKKEIGITRIAVKEGVRI